MALNIHACKVARSAMPLCAVRQYSAVAVSLDEALGGVASGLPLPSGVDAKPAVHVSTLKNGLKVATFETFSPVSTLGLVVGAGSAYETSSTIGASALFRQLAFKSNELATQFAVGRSTENIGGRLHALSSRDHLVLYATATRNHLDHLVDVLSNEFAYKTVLGWEVDQARSEIAYQSHAQTHDGAFQAIDMLHEAAFRGPLSYSVNPEKHRINSVSVDAVAQWAEQKYVTGNAVLVGFGVQHEDLVGLAERTFSDAKSGNAASRAGSKYGGNSEARRDTGSGTSYVAIGFEGAAAGSGDALAVGVLQHALGAGQTVKWGSTNGLLGHRLVSAVKAPASACAFSANYSDAGLFGVLTSSGSDNIGSAVSAVRDVLKAVATKGLSPDDVARGKALFKLCVLSCAENVNTGIEHLGGEVLATGKGSSPAEIAKAIDAISDNAVNEAAKKVLSSKPTLAAVGDLTQCPHLDQLV